MLVRMFSHLEANPVIEVLAKEIIGINAPRVAFIRTRDERIDAAFNEGGNTVGFFGGGFCLDKLLNVFYRKVDRQYGQTPTASQLLWRHLGKSLALGSVLFSVMWALPLIRNYLTAVRTGTDRFSDMIGAKGFVGPTAEEGEQEDFETRKNRYLRNGLLVFGAGIVGAVLVVLGSHWAIRRALPLGDELARTTVKPWIGQAGDWVRNKFGLKDGMFKNFGDVHAVWFWAAPAYASWILSARDAFEQKEWILKTVNFLACFTVIPWAIRRAFVSRYPQQVRDIMVQAGKGIVKKRMIDAAGLAPAEAASATRLWVIQSVTSLLASLTLLGASPNLINIWLTGKRLEAAHRLRMHPPGRRPVIPAGRLVRKPFEQFVPLAYNQRGMRTGVPAAVLR